MKKMRTTCALLLCALFLMPGSVAQAAKKKTLDREAVPSVTLVQPPNSSVDEVAAAVETGDSAGSGLTSGSTLYLDLKATLPGFMSLRLTDAYGSEMRSICVNHEIHSGENTVAVPLRDNDDNLLPSGVYTISGDVFSQFNVSASIPEIQVVVAMPVNYGSTAPGALSVDPALSALGGADPLAGDASLGYGDALSYGDGDGDYAGSGIVQAPVSVPSIPTDVVTYTSNAFLSVGEEGLMIGVGPSDVANQSDAGYWGLTSSASDAEIWAALTREMVCVDVDERESAYIYDSPYEGRNRLGTLSGLSQGVNVITQRNDGWSLVEAFRNEDGAFVRGYMQTKRLRSVEPNTTYGLVIDKRTQVLTVYRAGQRVGSCSVSTGLPTPEYLQRETPAGEYITVTRRGETEYAGGRGYCQYSIRISGNYHLCEIPATKSKGSNFSLLEGSLGSKASRGNVVIAHNASTDGGINAKWIWDLTESNKKIKVLIFDDKERSDVPVGN